MTHLLAALTLFLYAAGYANPLLTMAAYAVDDGGVAIAGDAPSVALLPRPIIKPESQNG